MHCSPVRQLVFALVASCGVVVGPNLTAQELASPSLGLKTNDSIVILGNTFAERMQLFGYFESFLHCRFPVERLRIRSMAWPADEVVVRERPLGFPKLFDELHGHRADVLFLCFGMNESFRGTPGLAQFRRELHDLVVALQQQRFNGVVAPRIVLVSPIAHEKLEGDLREIDRHNKELEEYTEEMAAVARQTQAQFIDLYAPTLNWHAPRRDRTLTFNGIHLSEYGDWVVSQVMARSLGLVADRRSLIAGRDGVAPRFRRLVFEKNYHFHNWWHAANASYIHGRRNDKPGAQHLADERAAQLQLIDYLDQEIWGSEKPAPQQVWGPEPADGKPIWHPTPPDREIPGAKIQPQWSLAADGDRDDPSSHINSPADQLARFRLPPGYEVNLFASELQFPIANPMALQFDSRGRLWVANTPTWPHPLPGKQPRDSIVVLTDHDRDGTADSHQVFVDRFNMIHGFALGPDGVYIAQTPNLVLARDTDGDSQADWFRIVLHGFGAEDAEHSMNNFRWSPGGSLFFTQGIFFHTQVETPDGPARVRDAAAFHYHPVSQEFGVYASHVFSNPYGNVFDRWGRPILLDASAGDYYPLDLFSANFAFPKQKERTRHLSFGPGGSIAAGCDFLRSPLFPPQVQGRFLVNHCEGEVGTHWYTLSSAGTNYRTTRHDPPLLTCGDRTFRPVAMTLGPDGALYIADFYSHIFENVNFSKRHPGRDHAHGRIWRVSSSGSVAPSLPDLHALTSSELLELLRVAGGQREFVRRELQRRGGAEVVPALDGWIAGLDDGSESVESDLCEAMWIYQSLDVVNADLLRRLLASDAVGVRIAATQSLRFWQGRIEGAIELVRERIDDPDPRVRLQAVLACSFSDSPAALETALGVAAHDMDAGLQFALDQTVAFLEQRE